MVSCGLAAGCDPLIATVGVDDPIASQSPDGGNVADATKPVEEHDAANADANANSFDASDVGTDAAASSGVNCVLMPDLADPYTQSDGGIRSIDTGEIYAAVDEELGCTQARMDKSVYVTYMRSNREPLMRDGITYVIPAPPGSGGTLNTYLGRSACEQGFIPTLWFFLAPPIGGCGVPPGRGAVWRMLVPVPSPFPGGFQLCESRCP